jgi:hypothetical protein
LVLHGLLRNLPNFTRVIELIAHLNPDRGVI